MKKYYLLISVCLPTLMFAQSPVPDGAEVELIASGFEFVEGPVWSDDIGLLFSDMNGNKIYNWTEEDSISVFLNPSDNSNGLTYDLEGNLIMNQTGLRRVARLDSNGTQTSLADMYQGKKLNSPNDLAVKSDGAIFFTDPNFNIPPGQQQELPYQGIFRISPYGELQLLDSTLTLPNGICFSPDESKLYVNDSQARIIYVWDVVDDSTIVNKKEFARISPRGYADGMKIDSSGNIFCAGPLGVWIFSPDGTFLDTILVPINPSNCNWGDADRKTLFITAGTNVYKIRLAPITKVKDKGYLPGNFKLYQNYPNPFNPTTKIRFTIASNSSIEESRVIKLKVYDILGNEVATLVNEEKPAGNYEVEFSSTSGTASSGKSHILPSGIYLYQLIAGDFTQTKKLILLK
jgi:gluconolactonase